MKKKKISTDMCFLCQVKCCVADDDDGEGHLTTLDYSMQSAGDRLEASSSSSSSSSLDSDGNDDAMTSAWREFMALSSDSDDDEEVDAQDDVDGRVSTVSGTWPKRYTMFANCQ